MLLRNPHVMTIMGRFFRRIPKINYTRERLELSDGDFLDLDWVRNGDTRLMVISHGLEGSSSSAYVLAMAQAATQAGWDVLAWNQRSCSGEPNRLLRFYHSGSSDELGNVVDYVLNSSTYRSVALVGFSLGGNVTVKYLGEKALQLDGRISGAVAISVPCDLSGCAQALARPQTRIYLNYFLHSLKRKLLQKQKLFKDSISLQDFSRIRSFHDYDGRYTAPMHGFPDAATYYARSSSKQFIEGINCPTLLLNSLDDPFLSPSCHPTAETQDHPFVTLELTRYGGHAGFIQRGWLELSWAEQRALEFLTQACRAAPLHDLT